MEVDDVLWERFDCARRVDGAGERGADWARGARRQGAEVGR